MKKKGIVLILWLLLSISLASCQSEIENSNDKGNEKTYEESDNGRIDFSNIYKPESIAGDYGGVKNNNLDNAEKKIKENVFLGDENYGGLNESEALQRIQAEAKKINRDPVNAVFDDRTWTVKKKGVYGKRVNVQKTLENLINASPGEKVELVVDEVKPDITSKTLEENIRFIGGYTTVLLDNSESRVNNIKIACDELNYEIIQPGEEFSFNDILGRRTKSKGYRKAPIIKKTKFGPKRVYDYGGGICQISTTIYNAAKKCGLKITERHTHSKDVKYVPKGMDATVAYGSSDFRFVNNRAHPIMIRLYLEDRNLTVRIIENRN